MAARAAPPATATTEPSVTSLAGAPLGAGVKVTGRPASSLVVRRPRDGAVVGVLFLQYARVRHLIRERPCGASDEPSIFRGTGALQVKGRDTRPFRAVSTPRRTHDLQREGTVLGDIRQRERCPS